MTHTPLTSEQRTAIKKRIAEYREIEALCHHPGNLNEIRGAIVALSHMLEHGVPSRPI